jgi:anti-sigma factor RsiW
MAPFARFRRALVCRRAIALMSDYLDGVLPMPAARRLEAHLSGCPHCTEYLAQMRVAIEAAGRVEPDDLDPEVLDELVALYRTWRAG